MVSTRATQNLNDRLKFPGIVRVDGGIKAQAPVSAEAAAGDRFASAVSGLDGLVPAIASVSAPIPVRHTSFTDADLTERGADFLDAERNQNVVRPTAGAAQEWAVFSPTASWDDAHNFAGAGAALWEFTLSSYVEDADHPSTLGFEWDDAAGNPTTWFVGLSDWTSGTWKWYQGDSDSVITVEDLTRYIRSSDGRLLCAVVAFDSMQCTLQFIQAGAFEIRATGGLPPTSQEAFENDGPGFAVAERSASALPTSFELPLDWLGPVTNQDSIGSCAGHAAAGYVTYLMRKTYGAQYDPSWSNRYFSPQWIYLNCGGKKCDFLWKFDSWRTAEEALNYIRDEGAAWYSLAPEPWDCNEKNWDRAVAEANQHFFRIKSYRKLEVKGDKGISNMKYELTPSKRPVYLTGFYGGASWDVMTKDGYVPGEIFNWESTIVGNLPNLGAGHHTLVVGYDDSKQAFLIRNSWGEDWNQNWPGTPDGHFWLSYDSFRGNATFWGWVASMEYNQATANFLGISTPYGFTDPVAAIDASEGEFLDHVHLTWDTSIYAAGTQFLVYRDSTVTPIATVITSSYDDFLADKNAHNYYVRAKSQISGLLSPPCSPEKGYAALTFAPDVTDIAYHHSYSVPGQVELNATTDFPQKRADGAEYVWTFGGVGVQQGITIGPVWTVGPKIGQPVGPNPDVVPKGPGQLTVTVTVTNSLGSDSYSESFAVDPAPNAPTAAFTVPSPIEVRRHIAFDASASTTTGFGIMLYAIDFNGDTAPDSYQAHPKFQIWWDTPGVHTVGLQVQDVNGAKSAWTTQQVTVTGPKFPDEVEDNDSETQADGPMSAFQQYRGSVGQGHGYPNPYDGDLQDWWKFNVPADGSWSAVLTLITRDFVDYGNMIVYDKNLNVVGSNFTEVGNPADLVAQVDFAGATANNPYYVKVFADISTGGFDYDLGWAPGP
jgi:hypothetical protein